MVLTMLGDLIGLLLSQNDIDFAKVKFGDLPSTAIHDITDLNKQDQLAISS
jgi:hypothetical protein